LLEPGALDLVARLDELLVLAADLAGLERAAALQLGVELGAEQDAASAVAMVRSSMSPVATLLPGPARG
jgi:hypothetical protein